MADLIAAIGATPSHYAGTLPTLADGARTQEVLEASLASKDEWAQVQRADLDRSR